MINANQTSNVITNIAQITNTGFNMRVNAKNTAARFFVEIWGGEYSDL